MLSQRAPISTVPQAGLPHRIPLRDARGFTIIELLVATAIIILLLSILIVAVNAANRTGQKTRTQFLLGSMKQALVRFKEDIAVPAVLGASS
jgi:type II secretory pathway pseudopilin PulG